MCSPSHVSLDNMTQIMYLENASGDYQCTVTNAIAIPQYFKEIGYLSIETGKVFHHGGHDEHVALLISMPPMLFIIIY